MKIERLKENTKRQRFEKKVQTMRNKMIGGWEQWKLSSSAKLGNTRPT